MRLRGFAPLFAVGLAYGLGMACGGGEGHEAPRWISLADLHRPTPLVDRLRARLTRGEDGQDVRLYLEDAEPRLRVALGTEDWSRDGEQGWWTEPRHELLACAQPERGRLRLGDTLVGRVQSLTPKRPPTAPVFHFDGARLTLFGPGSDELPRDAVFEVGLDEGVLMDGTSWVVTGDLFGAGIPLWPDEELAFELPPLTDTTLRFVPALRTAHGPDPTVLRVLLDGRVLRELELAGDERPFVEVPLPPTSSRNARLSFEATGPPRLTVIYRPVLGPSALGRPGARPWSSTPAAAGRPDLVLFVADTLRADCLAAFGGDPDVTPHLNRLAERSRRFVGVRATASWTLPSVASLLTGVYPPQHGVERDDQGLGPAAVSIAERLRAHGYRTAAVTDSFFVSRRHGFQQGFEWFQEIEHGAWDLRRTLRAAQQQLDRDDGRPLFLLVHTYRVHKPYRSGVDEVDDDYARLLAEVRQATGGDPRAAEPALRARAGELAAMYVEGARGLDAVAGPWLADLVDSGRLSGGALILTSDHGEAFAEHDELWHKGPLWDEVVRVPLLIHSAAAEPGPDARNASLVDLVPTLAQLAGIALPAADSGHSLLAPPRARPVYSFWWRDEATTDCAVIAGEKKLMLSGALELSAAFDLARDPGEAVDLAADPSIAWPRELLERTLPELRELLERRGTTLEVPPGDDRRDAFAELGYADE